MSRFYTIFIVLLVCVLGLATTPLAQDAKPALPAATEPSLSDGEKVQLQLFLRELELAGLKLQMYVQSLQRPGYTFGPETNWTYKKIEDKK